MKRVFDVLISVTALLVLLPLMLLIALMIYLDDGGPVFYSQERLGRGGKRIRIWKFRSMKVNAEAMLTELTMDQRAQYSREFKIDNDPRVTGIGAFIRRTSIDELPQLWNIVCGDMSLVGPRPIVPEEIRCYRETELDLLHSIPAGLTGYWQAYAGPEDSYTTGGRQRMELQYAAHASFAFDMRIILKTFGTVVRKAKTDG